jgi:hypothetical protein
MRATRIAVAAAALSLSVAASALGAPAVTTVNGTVGPDFVINLTLAGKKVKKLEAGVPIASSSATARRSTTSTSPARASTERSRASGSPARRVSC